jgi:hypothetical protein
MILRTGELSSSRNAAHEELAGRELHVRDTTVLCGRWLKVATAEERQSAAELMRQKLFLLDPSQRRMSIEEYAAALLEDSEPHSTA